MPHTDLRPFIDAAKERGAGDEFLASLLTRRGWPASDVYHALGEWWEQSTGVAAPAHRGTMENSRDAFLYLLAFATLATWAGALCSLWFRLIEHWLPDTVVNPYFYNFRASVTWQMASILVALPVYLIVMRLIVREATANPDRLESGVRKWLTYIALLLAATGVVGDLVCFVDSVLRGEITARFVLKCLTVLVICGSIFWYYLAFLRGQANSRSFGGLAVAAAAAALGCGLAVAGTPSVQRQFEADNRRMQDLRATAGTLSSMPALPHSLTEAAAARPTLRVTDPQTGRPYEYTVKSTTEYELCATFLSAEDPRNGPGGSAFWSHAQGRACFAFELHRPVPW